MDTSVLRRRKVTLQPMRHDLCIAASDRLRAFLESAGVELVPLTPNEIVVGIQFRYDVYEIGIAVCDRYQDLPSIKEEFSPGMDLTRLDEANSVASEALRWLSQYVEENGRSLPSQPSIAEQPGEQAGFVSAIDNHERRSRLLQELPSKMGHIKGASIAVGGDGDHVFWLDGAIHFLASVLSRYGARVRFAWKGPRDVDVVLSATRGSERVSPYNPRVIVHYLIVQKSDQPRLTAEGECFLNLTIRPRQPHAAMDVILGGLEDYDFDYKDLAPILDNVCRVLADLGSRLSNVSPAPGDGPALKYLDSTMQFSFELPGNWEVLQTCPLKLAGARSDIDLTITTVRPELADRSRRAEVFITYLRSINMPRANVAPGDLGDETNVVIAYDPTADRVCLSAVHDNAHFEIALTGKPEDAWFQHMRRSFRFPPPEKTAAFVAAKEPGGTQVSQLLSQIDSGSEDAERTLLDIGHGAVDSVTASAVQVSERIKAVMKSRYWCSPPEIEELAPLFQRAACRLHLLGRLASPDSAKLLAGFVTDAALVSTLFPQASIVLDAGSDALVNVGKAATSVVEFGTRQPDAGVARAFTKILRAIQRGEKSVTGRPSASWRAWSSENSEEAGTSPVSVSQLRFLSQLWAGLFLVLCYLNLYVLSPEPAKVRLASFFVSTSNGLLLSYAGVLLAMAVMLVLIAIPIVSETGSRHEASHLLSGASLMGLAGVVSLVWLLAGTWGIVHPPDRSFVRPFFGCIGCLPFAAWPFFRRKARGHRLGFFARFVCSYAGWAMALITYLGLFRI